MRQTTLSVPLEVKPESLDTLSELIVRLRKREDSGEFGIPENYGRIMRDIPSLHFMSMSLFPHAEYDPLFILEANFDGPAGVFWGQMEAALGEDLRAILRCCKRPLDQDGALYDAVAARDSRSPVAPYFEARQRRPSVFHHGNRGLTRDRILADEQLFRAVRSAIDDPSGASPYRGLPADQAHLRLRAKLLPGFPWLGEKAVRRITVGEKLMDLGRLVLFGIAAIFLLALPGLVLTALLTTRAYMVVVALVAGAAALLVYRKRRAPAETEIASPAPRVLNFRNLLLLMIVVASYVLAASLLLTPVVVLARQFADWLDIGTAMKLAEAWPRVVRSVLLSLWSILLSVSVLLAWLRYLERRDSSNDSPDVDERRLREMIEREDWIVQNHMGSIVLVKPGVLRTIIIRAGHLGLGLLLRVKATDGYLASMRTIHFAHWQFVNNGSRLLFFSNFDHSWDSYLDDFIEKAHHGLTLAWTCGVGFPPTRFLIADGASHGRQFKEWALASRAVSRFWYSAYRDLTVDQIERNHRIADGLRRPSLSEEQARTWMRDL